MQNNTIATNRQKLYLATFELTSGTRLLNLNKKRLVKRVDEIRDGGRVWVYEKI